MQGKPKKSISRGTLLFALALPVLGLGYLATGILFAMVIASLTFGYVVLGLDTILGFWQADILTRPLGASLGDLLSQPAEYGGMGLGTIITSALFLAAIAGIVEYMSMLARMAQRT